jgi:hypothetical protein
VLLHILAAVPHSMFPPTPEKVLQAIQAIIQGSFDFVTTIGKLVV